MSNPLNAFLQGMAVVDRLETNRQRRDYMDQQRMWQHEEMSQIRKRWKREDDEYERQQLELYRGKKLVELEATMADILRELPAGSAMFNDEIALIQEAHKRMIARDPSFGEHVALAMRLDPAAGRLVDKKNPVSGLGFAPGRGVFFELNTQNGKQPYTDNRSSADNDPVTFRQPGLQELVGIYGQGVMTNNFLIAGQLRRMVGADQVTGNALSTQDKQTRTQQPEKTAAPEPDSVAAQNVADDERAAERHRGTGAGPEERAERARIEEERAAYDRQQRDEQLSTQYEDNEAKLREIMTNPRAQTGERLLAGARKLVSDFFGPNETTKLLERDWDANPPAPEEMPMGPSDFLGGGRLNKLAGALHDQIHEAVYGMESPTKGQTLTSKVLGKELSDAAKPDYPGSKPRETAATTPKDIQSDGNKASDYSPSKLAQPGEDTGKALMRTPPPGNADAAAQSARTVLAPVKNKRPNLMQMYNAVSLAKMKLVSVEQLHRYAATGQMNEAAKADLQIIQSGGWARVFDKNTGTLSAPIPIDPTKGGDDSSDEDRFDLATKLLEDFFVDEDGKPDRFAARQAVRKLDRAGDVLANAFNGGKDITLNQNFANDFEDGLRLIRNYEDPRGIFSMKWFDNKNLRDRSGIVGYLGVQLGITNPNEFNDFAYNYGIEFIDWAEQQGWSEERKAAQIIELERAHKEDKKSREEIFEDFIDKVSRNQG